MKRKKDNKYVVYLHTLKSDGRKYVGITCQKPEKRWKNGGGYQTNKYFWRAIQKYGWNNFKHEILFENLSGNQACLKEQALIKLFNTTDYKFGFNLTTGGEHYEVTNTVRQKISEAETVIKISRSDLEYQYITLNKTQKQCAVHFNCSEATINRNLKKHHIKKSYIPKTNKIEISYEELSDLYLNQNMQVNEIANILGCSHTIINRHLQKYTLKKSRLNLSSVQLNELYEFKCVMNLNISQIANRWNYTSDRRLVRNLLKKYNMYT